MKFGQPASLMSQRNSKNDLDMTLILFLIRNENLWVIKEKIQPRTISEQSSRLKRLT